MKTKKFLMKMSAIALILLSTVTQSCYAAKQDASVLLFGGSYANGKVNFNDGTESPLFGIAVNFNDYLSLGQALEQRKQRVTNEAWAGDGTFERISYIPGSIALGTWPGMETQVQRALARVFDPSTNTYIVRGAIVDLANDCLHANAFGIPQEQTSPCTTADMHAVADRFVAFGVTLEAAGIKTIFNIMPISSDIDLSGFSSNPGLLWGISDADWDELRGILMTRIAAELPNAILVDCYKNLVPIGDGIHPDELSMRRCARRDLTAFEEFEESQE